MRPRFDNQLYRTALRPNLPSETRGHTPTNTFEKNWNVCTRASSGCEISEGPTEPKRCAVARSGRAADGADEDNDDEGMEKDEVDGG